MLHSEQYRRGMALVGSAAARLRMEMRGLGLALRWSEMLQHRADEIRVDLTRHGDGWKGEAERRSSNAFTLSRFAVVKQRMEQARAGEARL